MDGTANFYKITIRSLLTLFSVSISHRAKISDTTSEFTIQAIWEPELKIIITDDGVSKEYKIDKNLIETFFK